MYNKFVSHLHILKAIYQVKATIFYWILHPTEIIKFSIKNLHTNFLCIRSILPNFNIDMQADTPKQSIQINTDD